MRKFRVVGIALFVVFAFGAFAASQALALTSMWLVDGLVPTVKELADSEGELLLKDTGTGAMVLCSGLNEGWIAGETNAFNVTWDEITNITGLNAATEPIWILCTTQEICESTTVPEARALNLPWLTELLLTLNGTEEIFLDDLIGTNGEAGWAVRKCLVLGIEQAEDKCTLNSSADIDNTTEGDVLALFSDAITGLANCSLGGAGTGEVEGEILILLVSGLSLAVSEA